MMNKPRKTDMTETETSDNKAYSAPIVSKAIRVLKMIAGSPKTRESAKSRPSFPSPNPLRTGFSRPWEESGWVLRDPITRKYSCGYAVKNLARAADIRIPLVVKARPYLEKLAKRIG